LKFSKILEPGQNALHVVQLPSSGSYYPHDKNQKSLSQSERVILRKNPKFPKITGNYWKFPKFSKNTPKFSQKGPKFTKLNFHKKISKISEVLQIPSRSEVRYT